jgi:hypothetical protein
MSQTKHPLFDPEEVKKFLLEADKETDLKKIFSLTEDGTQIELKDEFHDHFLSVLKSFVEISNLLMGKRGKTKFLDDLQETELDIFKLFTWLVLKRDKLLNPYIAGVNVIIIQCWVLKIMYCRNVQVMPVHFFIYKKYLSMQ